MHEIPKGSGKRAIADVRCLYKSGERRAAWLSRAPTVAPVCGLCRELRAYLGQILSGPW